LHGGTTPRWGIPTLILSPLLTKSSPAVVARALPDKARGMVAAIVLFLGDGLLWQIND
jgi:hypothetical protein